MDIFVIMIIAINIIVILANHLSYLNLRSVTWDGQTTRALGFLLFSGYHLGRLDYLDTQFCFQDILRHRFQTPIWHSSWNPSGGPTPVVPFYLLGLLLI